jgi:hypothetical protein
MYPRVINSTGSIETSIGYGLVEVFVLIVSDFEYKRG